MPTRTLAPGIVTLTRPRPGSVVGLPPGTRLSLRLRPGLGASRWHVADQPKNLLLLVHDDAELTFLVFDGPPATLRLERRYPRGEVVREVCELRIRTGAADTLAVAGRRSA